MSLKFSSPSAATLRLLISWLRVHSVFLARKRLCPDITNWWMISKEHLSQRNDPTLSTNHLLLPQNNYVRDLCHPMMSSFSISAVVASRRIVANRRLVAVLDSCIRKTIQCWKIFLKWLETFGKPLSFRSYQIITLCSLMIFTIYYGADFSESGYHSIQ